MTPDTSFRRLLESAAAHGFMTVFSILPLDVASWLGGRLGRTIGPITGIHRKARRQMYEIMPDKTEREVNRYLTGMWDNLGRVMAEYPHLRTIMRTRVTVDDQAGMIQSGAPNRAAIFVSGHFANWEIAGPTMLHVTGAKVDLVYRAANNKHVDGLLNYYRSMNGALTTIPKSRKGMRDMIDTLKEGGMLGILVDQKYNEGIAADFFGKPAMSSTAYVQMGQRFNCPVYPVQVIRTRGAHFKIVVCPPLQLFNADDTPRDMAEVVHDMHALMDGWMRAHPDQWLWVHQRWSSKKLLELTQKST